MNLAVACRVEEHSVSCPITAPMRTPYHVVVVPPGEVGDRLGADGADATLLLLQVQQRPSAAQGGGHLQPEPGFEVAFPGWVIRIGCSFDLDVPKDGHAGGGEQLDRLGTPFRPRSFAAENPLTPAVGQEVFVLDPAAGLLGVTPTCPAPERQEDRVVHFGKGVFAGHVAVVGRPVPNDWVELTNQIPGGGLLVRLDDPSGFLQKGSHVLARWLDQNGAVVLTYMLSKEIKAILDPRNPGLLC